MPIYEYRCSSCGHQQEFLRKLTDAPLTTCTKCGKPSLSKMLSAAGFQLKGSGWYATDFKSSGSKPAVKSGDESKPAAKSEDSKPSAETKTEEKKAAPSSGAGGSPAS